MLHFDLWRGQATPGVTEELPRTCPRPPVGAVLLCLARPGGATVNVRPHGLRGRPACCVVRAGVARLHDRGARAGQAASLHSPTLRGTVLLEHPRPLLRAWPTLGGGAGQQAPAAPAPHLLLACSLARSQFVCVGFGIFEPDGGSHTQWQGEAQSVLARFQPTFAQGGCRLSLQEVCGLTRVALEGGRAAPHTLHTMCSLLACTLASQVHGSYFIQVDIDPGVAVGVAGACACSGRAAEVVCPRGRGVGPISLSMRNARRP